MAALPAQAVGADTPLSGLLERLDGVRQTGTDRWVARCPAHDDKHPSLSVRETGDGTLLVRCWSGCSAAEVVHAAGLTLADLFPPRPQDHHRGPIPTRSRWDRADVWLLLQHESAIAAIVAADAAAGRPVTADDAERVGLAADRLADACAALGVRS